MHFLDHEPTQVTFHHARLKRNREGERRITFGFSLPVTAASRGLTATMVRAIEAMEQDDGMTSVALGETIASRNLVFGSTPHSRSKIKISAVDLNNFLLERSNGVDSPINLSMEFTAPMNDIAAGWFWESFASDIFLQVEEVQAELNLPAGDESGEKPEPKRKRGALRPVGA